MMRRLCLLTLLFSIALAPFQISAAVADSADADSPIMLVIDSSGSMAEDDGTGKIKIDGAKLALLDFLNNVTPNTPMGLLSYPAKGSSECDPGSPAFEIERRDPETMSAFIRGLTPDGDTPTAEALQVAFDKIKENDETGTLVLVSDGESTCDPPCDTANELASQGVDIDTITVGFKISDDGREELECIADALSGRYVDANDNEELQNVLDDLSRPKLTISKLTYPAKVVAEVGDEGDGRMKIQATVTNDGKREAKDVSVRLRFDLNGPGVARPIARIGNLAGGKSQVVTWSFWPPASAIDNKVDFTVIASATNSATDAERTGSFRVVNLSSAGDAGPILKGKKRIVIAGDSYSSGEGAEDYFRNSDRKGNACHQSPNTYLRKTFSLPEQNVIACSGAVASNIASENAPNGRPAQITELGQLYRNKPSEIQAVVMTLGGNDFQFPTLAASCVAGIHTCDDRIYSIPGMELWGGTPYEEFKNKGVGNDSSYERGQILEAYRAVDRILNNKEVVDKRGAVAPILVLGYPMPIPLTGRSCLPMGNTLTQGEISKVGEFATLLNGVVEGIVNNLQKSGRPVFYVPNTENALLPDHTICDPPDRAYARSLASADPEVAELLSGVATALAAKNAFYFWSDEYRKGRRSLSELVHPNAKGHAAISSAILRWTRGPGGLAADAFLKSAQPNTDSELYLTDGAIDEDGNPILQGSTGFPLQASGYAPNSDASIFIRSEPHLAIKVVADEAGRVRATVPIPDGLAAGQHHIEVDGFGQNGKQLTKSVPFRFEKQREYSAGLIIATLGLAGLLAMLIVLASSRTARDDIRAWRARTPAPAGGSAQ